MKITYTSIDGVRRTTTFRSLEAARKYAYDRVGSQDYEGGHYAVSDDGVGRITWVGVTRAELFKREATSKLNKVTTFFSRGNDLFCRQAGYTHDHEGQKFGRVVEVMDNITGDYHDGFRLRHNDGESHILFDEERKYATRDAALAAAKQAYLDYLAYLHEGDMPFFEQDHWGR